MENSTRSTAPTLESVWALFQETDRKMRETDRRMQETDRILSEKIAATDRQMQETDRRFRAMQKEMGSIANNQGAFAEEYFFNSFEKDEKNFFGEKFDKIMKNVGGINVEDEYDILLVNGNSVGIIEVKFKAHENDIPKVLKKVNTFRSNFSAYANHRIYLGLATMAFYPKLEDECVKNGIAIIKQVGDVVVIKDEHLKEF